jgi:hypothetical protein
MAHSWNEEKTDKRTLRWKISVDGHVWWIGRRVWGRNTSWGLWRTETGLGMYSTLEFCCSIVREFGQNWSVTYKNSMTKEILGTRDAARRWLSSAWPACRTFQFSNMFQCPVKTRQLVQLSTCSISSFLDLGLHLRLFSSIVSEVIHHGRWHSGWFLKYISRVYVNVELFMEIA